jgi:DNA recombination protein RmuC
MNQNMDTVTLAPYAFLITMLIACGIAIAALMIIKQLHLKLKACEIALATAQGAISNADEHLADYHQMKGAHDTLIAERSRAIAERDELEKQLEVMRRERDIAAKSKERAEFLKSEAERKMQLTEQKIADMHERMRDWEKQKEESVQAARAAILKAGGEMSSKLLEDHKREMEAAKQQSEERVPLKDSTLHTREQMEVVMRSLTNPAGVGQMAEVGLENSLKNLGLVKNRDFVIQYHVAQEEGKNLRPDAIIFLPQDTVMVIDCKASKAMLEIARANTEEEHARAVQALKKTMNEHVKALASRDYRAAVLQSFRDAGKSESVGHIFNVMYLPSESAIEQIRDADPEFDGKLQKSGIILAGPSSLAGLFSLAKMNIAAAHQAENEKVIIQLVADLMESTITALGHVDKVGRDIKAAADHFDAFSKSVNSRMLPRMRALKDLGVTPTRHKDIPAPLASYDIRRVEQTVVIESVHEETRTVVTEEKIHPLTRVAQS